MSEESDCAHFHDEDSSSSLMPSSWASAHEVRNPFKSRTSCGQGETTPRYFSLPAKPSGLNYSMSDAAEVTKRVITKGRSTSGDTDLVEPEDSLASSVPARYKPRAKTSVRHCQIETNPELAKQLAKLARFKGIDESWLDGRRVNLRPLKTHKKTLILDLDGTLICSSYRATYKSDDASPQPEVVTMARTNGDDTRSFTSFHIRPHVMRLLKTLRFFYEIIVFTAGKESYAKPIVEYLDPKKCCIAYLLHRDQCVQVKDWIIKDLRVVGRRELKDMVIVDNSVISFAGNLDNGIYVPTYEGDPNDRELLPIIDFLKEIHSVDDVRPYVREFAGISDLLSVYRAKL